MQALFYIVLNHKYIISKNDIFVVVMREKIKQWLGIGKLECELNELKNEKLIMLKTIEELKNDIRLLNKELSELSMCKGCIDDIKDRLTQMEIKLNELESFHKPLDVVSVENIKNSIEDEIINIVSNGKDVCISDLLSYTNLSTRELYNILDNLENSKKIKRRRKGKKVIIQLL